MSLSTWRVMLIYTAAAAAKTLQSCPTLCDPIDGSPPGSPVPGILQARTLEWVAISFSNASFFTLGILRCLWTSKHLLKFRVYLCVCVCVFACAHSRQSSVVSNSLRPHGLLPARLLCPWIFQARILEWVAMPFSRGSSWPRDQSHISLHLLHWQAGSLPLRHLGSPLKFHRLNKYHMCSLKILLMYCLIFK